VKLRIAFALKLLELRRINRKSIVSSKVVLYRF
jgi:hypothetical protein